MVIKNNYLTILINLHKKQIIEKAMEPPVHAAWQYAACRFCNSRRNKFDYCRSHESFKWQSRCPSKSKHFWWRSRFLIKLTISIPSATLSVKIFVSSLLHNKLKFTRKSRHAKKKFSTFSVSFLQMKQESPLLPVSHGTPAFRPKLHINLVCVCK